MSHRISSFAAFLVALLLVRPVPADDKTADKKGDKPSAAATDSSAAKKSANPDDKKSTEKKPAEKASAKTDEKKPAEKKATDNPAAKADDKKPAEKPAAKPGDKPAEKPASAKTDKPAEKPIAKKADKPAASSTAKGISFRNEVAPILVRNCLACHGQSDPKGDYQLHTFAALKKAGESGLESITPGKPADSQLLALISSKDASERMPKDAEPLPAEQIALLRRWIEQGAKLDAPDPQALIVSLLPRRTQPAPPEKYRAALPVTALAFNTDGKELAVSGYHEITLWNPDDGKLLRRIPDVEERVYALAYTPDGTMLAAAGGSPGQSGEVSLYDPVSGRRLRTLVTTAEVIFTLSISSDGKKLACGGADRTIRLFDLASGASLGILEDHADWVQGIAWNREATRLASGSRDKSAKWLDAEKREALLVYSGHGETVYSVAVSPDSKLVYSAGGDRKIHSWNTDDAKQAAVFGGFGGEVFRIVLAGDRLFGCSADKTIRMFDIAQPKKELRSFSGHTDQVFAIDFHAATKRLASGSFDGEVRVWNTDDGKGLVTFKAAPGM